MRTPVFVSFCSSLLDNHFRLHHDHDSFVSFTEFVIRQDQRPYREQCNWGSWPKQWGFSFLYQSRDLYVSYLAEELSLLDNIGRRH